MNRNLWLLAICQGLLLTNNVTFIAINGLVGLAIAPRGWCPKVPGIATCFGVRTTAGSTIPKVG